MHLGWGRPPMELTQMFCGYFQSYSRKKQFHYLHKKKKISDFSSHGCEPFLLK